MRWINIYTLLISLSFQQPDIYREQRKLWLNLKGAPENLSTYYFQDPKASDLSPSFGDSYAIVTEIFFLAVYNQRHSFTYRALWLRGRSSFSPAACNKGTQVHSCLLACLLGSSTSVWAYLLTVFLYQCLCTLPFFIPLTPQSIFKDQAVLDELDIILNLAIS